MQRAGAFHRRKLAFDLGKPLVDHAAVGLELGFAWPAEETKTTALALEVGPRTNQPAFLVSQMRMLDLQRAFACAGAAAKNLQDQPGAIQDLCIPCFFQIALLHRRQCAIHDHDASVDAFDETRNLFDFALAEKGCRPQRIEHDDAGLFDIEIDGASKADGLIEFCRGRSFARNRRGSAQDRLNDQGPAGACTFSAPVPRRSSGLLRRQWAPVAAARLQSNLFPGRRFLGAFEQLHWVARHNR